jgi:alpha-L-fucosidase
MPNKVSTCKGATHYIHLLDYLSDCEILDGVPETVTSAHLLRDGSEVRMNWVNGNQLMLTIPADMRDVIDTVVVLE